MGVSEARGDTPLEARVSGKNVYQKLRQGGTLRRTQAQLGRQDRRAKREKREQARVGVGRDNQRRGTRRAVAVWLGGLIWSSKYRIHGVVNVERNLSMLACAEPLRGLLVS